MAKKAYIVMYYDKQEDDMHCIGVYSSLESAVDVYTSFLLAIGHGNNFGYASYSYNGISVFRTSVMEFAKICLDTGNGNILSDGTKDYHIKLEEINI